MKTFANIACKLAIDALPVVSALKVATRLFPYCDRSFLQSEHMSQWIWMNWSLASRKDRISQSQSNEWIKAMNAYDIPAERKTLNIGLTHAFKKNTNGVEQFKHLVDALKKLPLNTLFNSYELFMVMANPYDGIEGHNRAKDEMLSYFLDHLEIEPTTPYLQLREYSGQKKDKPSGIDLTIGHLTVLAQTFNFACSTFILKFFDKYHQDIKAEDCEMFVTLLRPHTQSVFLKMEEKGVMIKDIFIHAYKIDAVGATENEVFDAVSGTGAQTEYIVEHMKAIRREQHAQEEHAVLTQSLEQPTNFLHIDVVPDVAPSRKKKM